MLKSSIGGHFTTSRHILKLHREVAEAAIYLNRVELQNGCLSLAHANLFIPSTLNGSCCSGGDIDKEKLTQNLMSAAEVYIQRCNNVPCGDTEIQILSKLHKSVQGSVPEQTLLAKAKEVQLSMSDVKFWMLHLDTIHENHKKEEQKALETR